MRPQLLLPAGLVLGLAAISGCALVDEPLDEPTSVASAIGTSPCVYGTLSPVGSHVIGWVIDLCNGAPAPGNTIFVSSGTTGRRDLFFGTCEYWEGAFMWCSANTNVTVDIGGTIYSGLYGYDIDAHAGGQLGEFRAQSITTGLASQDFIPFPYSL